jgi:hypothetical protein
LIYENATETKKKLEEAVKMVCRIDAVAGGVGCTDEKGGHEILNNESLFSAPDYMFVSVHAARHFPDLLESAIVGSYKSHVVSEEQSARWMKHSHAARTAAATDSFYILKLFPLLMTSCLLVLGSQSPKVQILFVSTINPLIITILAFIGTSIFPHQPLSGIPVAICIALVIMMCLWWRAKMREEKRAVEGNTEMRRKMIDNNVKSDSNRNKRSALIAKVTPVIDVEGGNELELVNGDDNCDDISKAIVCAALTIGDGEVGDGEEESESDKSIRPPITSTRAGAGAGVEGVEDSKPIECDIENSINRFGHFPKVAVKLEVGVKVGSAEAEAQAEKGTGTGTRTEAGTGAKAGAGVGNWSKAGARAAAGVAKLNDDLEEGPSSDSNDDDDDDDDDANDLLEAVLALESSSEDESTDAGNV